MQASMQSYTGIMGIGDQDHAVVESMGDIYDRSREHLGTSDLMVIRLRRLLLKWARELQEHGTPPLGVDDPEAYVARSGGIVLPNGINGVEVTYDLQTGRETREAFHERHALAPMVENHGV
jgi:hypothetical protein